MYSVICCPYCGGCQVTTAVKSKPCVYCGKRINMRRVRVWYRCNTIEEAREKLIELVLKQSSRRLKLEDCMIPP